MPSSTSNSRQIVPSDRDPGFDRRQLHHAPLSPGLRLTASDRPGVAQPVPQRDVPVQPWRAIAAVVLVLVALLTAGWEWRMRTIGLVPGDLGDDPSAWAEQRRRVDDVPGGIVIVGDSRILFDTDLDRFQRLAGVRPIQLAIAGSNGLPFLEQLAADPRFHGLVIVGIADLAYFHPGLNRGREALDRLHWEAPDQRTSLLLDRALRRGLAMLDDSYGLSTIVAQTDPDWRRGVRGPYDDIWKLDVTADDRQTWLWPEIERNAYLRNHARTVWLALYSFAKPTPPLVAATIARTRAAVVKIRTRGGDVVFVRPPSVAPLRSIEDQALPRMTGWDTLLRTARVKGIHADDMPNAQGLVLPEMSHLTRACATVFTDAYVRSLATLISRIRILPQAPSTLIPANCKRAGMAP